jgi:hypothetical protein
MQANILARRHQEHESDTVGPFQISSGKASFPILERVRLKANGSAYPDIWAERLRSGLAGRGESGQLGANERHQRALGALAMGVGSQTGKTASEAPKLALTAI